jgi:phosphate ABC transporter ATP-binding protein
MTDRRDPDVDGTAAPSGDETADPFMTDVMSAGDVRVLDEVVFESAPLGAATPGFSENPAVPAPDATRAGLGIVHRRSRRGGLFGRREAEAVPTAGADDVTTVIPAPGEAGSAAAAAPAAVVAPVQVATAVDEAEPILSAPVDPASLSELDAHSISAWFGDHQVLLDVSLTMPRGQVTALIGPSGCGKSTFLRILNRMHELVPSASLAGEVRLDGDDIYDSSHRLIDARKNIGMVFQKPNPFPAMSIYDNVIAGLKLTGTRASRDERDYLVERSLTSAGLWKEVKDRLRAPGGGLSGGQQQRLCIARSLAIKPKVLLMDEPCSALDPTSTRVIEETMGELQKELTIVIVTHNMQQAQRVSQQCAFFLASQGQPGHIVEHGDTQAMFDSPIDPRTYDYVNGRFG